VFEGFEIDSTVFEGLPEPEVQIKNNLTVKINSFGDLKIKIDKAFRQADLNKTKD